MIVHFSSQTMEAKWARHTIFQAVKKQKKFQPRILYPAKKIPLNEEEINIFSNDGKENLSPADLP